ncbi:MAG: DUF1786 domain-containing protein [Desulfobacteraceae bacterium]|nr:DUF1786 domain-containing protein [Desulfobacteraceae bacterium]
MRLFLLIDIGAGTMDILCYDADSREHYKAVVVSPVRQIGRYIAEKTTGPLAVWGTEMGGGTVTGALKARAEKSEVVITKSAAATLHHDMDRVCQWGLKIVDENQFDSYKSNPEFTVVKLADVQTDSIGHAIAAMGLPMQFEVVALCAQDHGVAPKGVSHLDFRHNLFQKYLSKSPNPAGLLFNSKEIPQPFNRLASMAKDAGSLNAGEIFVMDSGMAAILGACQDLRVNPKQPVAVLDIATSHTVAAIMHDGKLEGAFEYHTQDISMERLETLLADLAEGRLQHDRILAEGGHGAFVRRKVGFNNVSRIIATGPKRRLAANSRLPVEWGAPWGDNMMTGTVGLLEAVRQYKGMAPIHYL